MNSHIVKVILSSKTYEHLESCETWVNNIYKGLMERYSYLLLIKDMREYLKKKEFYVRTNAIN